MCVCHALTHSHARVTRLTAKNRKTVTHWKTQGTPNHTSRRAMTDGHPSTLRPVRPPRAPMVPRITRERAQRVDASRSVAPHAATRTPRAAAPPPPHTDLHPPRHPTAAAPDAQSSIHAPRRQRPQATAGHGGLAGMRWGREAHTVCAAALVMRWPEPPARAFSKVLACARFSCFFAGRVQDPL